MEKTEKTFGVCRYCGQMLNIKSYLALHPNIDDPDEDGIATLICDCKEASDSLNIADYDIVYIGCGTESASYKALECLKPYRRQLDEFIENNKLLIATGNSFELFGDYINDDK